MMFSPRMMPMSLFAYVVIGMCVSGCVKMNVIGQDGGKKGGLGTSEGISGFEKVVELVIEVHTAAIIPTVTPAEVTTIFNRASEIVQTSDELGEDVECHVKFTLKNGVVGRFNDAPQEIWDIYDLQELNERYRGVKVVRAINSCGSYDFWPASACTIPGQGVVAVREDPSIEPVLAVHEANHVFGGVHRDEPKAVMNPYFTPMNKLLNASECALYR
jgi:hypothetical protein